jgi:hypothetical protein
MIAGLKFVSYVCLIDTHVRKMWIRMAMLEVDKNIRPSIYSTLRFLATAFWRGKEFSN